MDINNDLQQINTFVKGMNTDVSDALMDSSQYRYAENVRLATNKDENTGELRLIEGNSIYSDLSNYGRIIAMTSVRNLLIVITKATGEDFILVKDVEDKDSKFRVTYRSAGGERLGEHISLVTRWESENNVKLYIADGEHPLMYINVTEVEEDDDTKYVVHTGRKAISGLIEAFINQPSVKIIQSGGSLNAPKLLYAYRLYKLGGSTTTMSPLSELVVLYESDNSGYAKYNEDLYKINKAVEITIPQNNVDADYLLIYRIAYVSVDESPEVLLIYDSEYTNTYTDTGINISKVSFTEFQSYSSYNDVPKIIESKNDYLFAANILDTKTKIDSKYEALQLSDYIRFKKTITKPVYINYKNEKKLTQGGANVREQIRSLRLGEVYRYGAVLYDSEGNHTSVKWICDLDLDTVIQNKSEYSPIKSGDTYEFKVIGAEFDIDWANLLSLAPDCVAVEIVRCDRTDRDRRTITQGIAGFPLRLHDIVDYDTWQTKELSAVCSTGLISANRFAVTGHMNSNGAMSKNHDSDIWANYQSLVGISDNSVLMFSSPDYVYHKNQIQDLIAADSSIKISFDGEAYTTTTDPQEYEQFDNNAIGMNLKRISGVYNGYNRGVPYSVFKADASILDLYAWLYMHYNSEGNGMPTYVNVPEGIATYIHTAKIASYIADVSYNEEFLAFPAYINKFNAAGDTNPKIFTSVSAFDVNLYNSSQILDTDYRTTIIYADVPKHDSLYDEFGTTFYGSDQVSVGSRGQDFVYLNWSIPISYQHLNENANCVLNDLLRVRHNDDFTIDNFIVSNYSAFQANDGLFTYPAGSTGECIVIGLQNQKDFYKVNSDDSLNQIGLYIVSLKHNVTPYGGDTEYSKEKSKYVSFGNVMLAGSGTTSYDIYDGDCYPGVFVYNACHGYFESGLGGGVTQSNVLMVPLYSDVDLSATYGDLFPNMGSGVSQKQWFQDIPCTIEAKNGTYVQSMEAYRYDSAYSKDPSAMTYMAIRYTKLDSENFDVRVKYSDPKTNNEHIDSWLKFSTNNFRDVDTRFGLITNMRLFKDKLLFWQEHATGVLSVNERTVLNDVENHDIIIGTGDGISRYDYISTVYGMKENQYDAEIQSNSTQYWWDGYNKEILAYGGGMELIPLTKIKGVTNYINQRTESEHPALMYDTKYDEIVAQVVGDESIVYNELIQTFSSVYAFMPLYRANIGNDLYIANEHQIYIQDKQDLESYSKLFNKPTFPKVRIVINKNNIYTKTFDNLTFGGRMYQGSLPTIVDWPMQRGNGTYVEDEHLNAPMHHLVFTFETPLKQKSAIRGDKATSVDEYDYRLAIPRNGSDVEYGNRMRGKTMQCEIASDYNSTDFSLQYITTKFRMSWS